MKTVENETYRTVLEISSLSSLLTPINQSYILNSINALLFSQQVDVEQQEQARKPPADRPA